MVEAPTPEKKAAERLIAVFNSTSCLVAAKYGVSSTGLGVVCKCTDLETFESVVFPALVIACSNFQVKYHICQKWEVDGEVLLRPLFIDLRSDDDFIGKLEYVASAFLAVLSGEEGPVVPMDYTPLSAPQRADRPAETGKIRLQETWLHNRRTPGKSRIPGKGVAEHKRSEAT